MFAAETSPARECGSFHLRGKQIAVHQSGIFRKLRLLEIGRAAEDPETIAAGFLESHGLILPALQFPQILLADFHDRDAGRHELGEGAFRCFTEFGDPARNLRKAPGGRIFDVGYLGARSEGECGENAADGFHENRKSLVSDREFTNTAPDVCPKGLQ